MVRIASQTIFRSRSVAATGLEAHSMSARNLDPELAHLLGDANDEPPITDDDSDFDPVAAFRDQIQFGIPARGGDPSAPIKKLSVVEITDALNRVRQVIGAGAHSALAGRLKKFPIAAMAQSAETYLEDDSPVRAFLKAASEGSDDGMKAAIRKIILKDGPLQ
jgi:hypothetical protein